MQVLRSATDLAFIEHSSESKSISPESGWTCLSHQLFPSIVQSLEVILFFQCSIYRFMKLCRDSLEVLVLLEFKQTRASCFKMRTDIIIPRQRNGANATSSITINIAIHWKFPLDALLHCCSTSERTLRDRNTLLSLLARAHSFHLLRSRECGQPRQES